jgi:peptidoglycan hydrolase-like protein with peptidoglycan-binding domain
MKTAMTAACALALGIAWSVAPAIAQDTTKDKAEQKAQKIEQKGEQKADETKAKAEEKADKVRAKAEDKTDSTGNKVEHAWDKTKAKTKEMTGKVKDKVSGHDNDRMAGRMSGDVRAAQQALQDKGFDPGHIDGVMGPKTQTAIKEFQQKNNLTVTGTLDAETRDRLIASSPPAASPGTEPSRTGQPKK